MSVVINSDEVFSVRLPQPIAAELRHIAEVEGNGASSVIRRLLRLGLNAERRNYPQFSPDKAA